MKSSQSDENIENISEIFYLLTFFSKTPREQWNIVPKDFAPAWVETAHFHCNIYSPILFLTAMLSHVLEDMIFENRNYNFNKDTIKLFQEEIYPLLSEWIIKAYDYNNDLIFENEEEATKSSKIWLVLKRLCLIALSYEDWDKYQANELSFDYFLGKYAYPYDPL
jgi:hypothetical protein